MWQLNQWLDTTSWQTVGNFWKAYGQEPPFPRDLDLPISLSQPLTIVRLTCLTLGSIENWLIERQAYYTFNCLDRSVRACLLVQDNAGLVFLDQRDPPAEQRFSLAHELAHFLIDYQEPRQTALTHFGPSIQAVLDGLRPPTLQERLDALFNGLKLDGYTNLMEREDNNNANPALWRIEDRADRIALTLLAPPETVLEQADLSARLYQQRYSNLLNLLEEKFGLPRSVATSYAYWLLQVVGKGPSWVESLQIR